MKCTYCFTGLLCIVSAQDLFNYDKTSGNDYGPEEWDKVDCPDLETCVSQTVL